MRVPLINWSSKGPGNRNLYRYRKSRPRPCQLTKNIIISVFGLILVSVSKHWFKSSQLLSDQKVGFSNEQERCNILSIENPHRILPKMNELDLNGCDLKEIPATIKYATNIRKLDVSSNPLKTLPSELIHCSKLEILFASSCPTILSLPKVLGKMNSITRLGWRSGSLKKIDPDSLPPNLVHLILTNNQIETFDDPQVLNNIRKVRKLMLSHNKLRSFGVEGGLEALKNLELLRLGGNLLNEIPDDLWNLPRLTWLTISGNPCVKVQMTAKVPSIKMSDLKPIGKYLGKGASGKVEQYEWHNKEVAVKLIHGVTSDGNAEDELAVYDAVGATSIQNRVVGCLALLNNERKGVVMEVLPPNLNDFALPPTIETITEDIWENNSQAFSAHFVKNALKDSITALAFLHNAGVSHGDFYAHNMKVDSKTGRVFLLDFGASFFKGQYASHAEKIEVRAFGVLVAELISKLDSKKDALSLKDKLKLLQLQCTNEIVSDRPSLKDVDIFVKTL